MLKIKDRATVYAFSISICMGSFVLGYQLTNLNFIGQLLVNYNNIEDSADVSESLNLIKSILSLAAIVGVICFKPITDAWGFLTTFKIIDIIAIIGCLIGIINFSVPIQVVSRLLLGLFVGMNTLLIPVYLTSVLPGSMGGPAGVLNQVFITLGIFFGFFFNYIIIGDQNSTFGWRFIIGIPIIPSLIRIYTTKNIYPYENVDRMIAQEDDLSLRSYLNLIYEPISLHDYKVLKKIPEYDLEAQKVSFFDPSGQPYLRRVLVASVVTLSNALCGLGALAGWAGEDEFIQFFGQDSVLNGFVYLNLVQVIVTFFASQFLETWGRRAFMREGQRIIIISLLLIGFIETFNLGLFDFNVPLIFIHMVGFSLAYGPCSFLIGTQLLINPTIPGLTLWIGITVFGFMNSSFIKFIGIGPLCLIYCICQILGYLYVSSNLVETQGTPRQQVYAQFREQCHNYCKDIKNNFESEQHSNNQLQMKFIDNSEGNRD